MVRAEDILDFWFEQSGSGKWFKKSDSFDADIRAKFEFDSIDAAAALQKNSPHEWEAEPDSALALVLMLDQFPRNMYRDTKAMFVWDELALGVASRAVKAGFDLREPQSRRAFFYMPYMHSELLAHQEDCVHLCQRGLDNPSTLHHAREHRRVIERFGRFPHRNHILGRKSTAEEQNFLVQGGYAP